MEYTRWQLEIIKKIKEKPRTVRDISEILDIPFPVVSPFILKLLKMGGVSRNKVDKHSHHEYEYSLIKDFTLLEQPLEWRCWLAGFFDGEGGVSAYIRKGSRPGATINVYITNTHKETIDEIQTRYPGYLHEKAGTNKPCYQITWSARKAQRILSDIFPFLRVKKKIVTKALQMLDTTQHQKRETKELRVAIVQEIRELNRKSKRTWDGKNSSNSNR